MSQVETGALSSAPTSHWGRAARKSANNEPLKARKMTVRILQKHFFSCNLREIKIKLTLHRRWSCLARRRTDQTVGGRRDRSQTTGWFVLDSNLLIPISTTDADMYLLAVATVLPEIRGAAAALGRGMHLCQVNIITFSFIMKR